ncbi:hypothetical protein GCM10020358_72380 [Amorphoplanes nipponensis]
MPARAAGCSASCCAGKRLHDNEVPSEAYRSSARGSRPGAIDGSLHFWIGRAKIPRQTDLAPWTCAFDVVDP